MTSIATWKYILEKPHEPGPPPHMTAFRVSNVYLRQRCDLSRSSSFSHTVTRRFDCKGLRSGLFIGISCKRRAFEKMGACFWVGIVTCLGALLFLGQLLWFWTCSVYSLHLPIGEV